MLKWLYCWLQQVQEIDEYGLILSVKEVVITIRAGCGQSRRTPGSSSGGLRLNSLRLTGMS